MPDPDLQIRRGGGGGSFGETRPVEIGGGGEFPVIQTLRKGWRGGRQFRLKIGGRGSPGSVTV